MKQTPTPSQGSDLWLIQRSSQSGGTKGDFRQRSERAGVNEKSDWWWRSHHRITSYCPLFLFSVHFLMCIWTDLNLLEPPNQGARYKSKDAVLGHCCSRCGKCFFEINIREKSKQTAVTSIISLCASRCVCDGGWLRQLPLANMLQHWTATDTDSCGGGGGRVPHLDMSLLRPQQGQQMGHSSSFIFLFDKIKYC